MKSYLALLLLTLALCSRASAFYRVLLVGDSIGTGYGVTSNESFARYLADGLRAIHPDLRLVNVSQNGRTTAITEAQIDRFIEFSGKPEVFILELGGNDFRNNVDAKTAQQQIGTILNFVHQKLPAAKLVVIGVGYPASATSPYRAAAEQMGAICVDGFDWESRDQKEGRQSDNIHPAASGHKEMAQAVLSRLL